MLRVTLTSNTKFLSFQEVFTKMATETAKSLSIRSTTKLSPRDIVVREDINFSRFTEHDRKELEYLAWKMSVESNTNPVHVIRVPGSKDEVMLVAGYKRRAAGMLILEGFDYTDSVTGDKIRVHDPDFKLQILNVNISEDEILEYNISENANRTDLSPMDWAKIVRLYKTIKGLSTAQIASKFSKSITQIDNWDSLNKLSDEHKRGVHLGEIPYSSAVELAKLSKEKAEEVVNQAKVTGKKPSLQSVKDARREQAAEKGTGEKVARTSKQIRLFFEEERGIAEFTPIRKIADSVIEFMQGTVDEKQMKQSLTKACKVSAVTMLQFLAEKYDSVIPQGVKYEALAKACMDWEVSKRQEEV